MARRGAMATRRAANVAFLVIALALIAAAVGLWRKSDHPSTPTEQPTTDLGGSTYDPVAAALYNDAAKQQAFIEQSEATIRPHLHHPESAQFRNVRFYIGSGVPIACGEVSGGEASGFDRFVAGSAGLVLESQMVSRNISGLWNQFCR